MTETITGYKWIKNDWKSKYGIDPAWEIGVWKEAEGKLTLCKHGYHACHTALKSIEYQYGNRLVIVEAEDLQEEADKFVARRMRVITELPTKEIMIEFAIACAKHVLYLYEEKYPEDNRPRKAIETAASIAFDTVTSDAADAAHAADAASDAADAAHAAVYAAGYAARAAHAAGYAADAASAAARAAHAAGYAADTYTASEAAAHAARAARNAAYIAYDVYAASDADINLVARKKEKKWQEQKLAQIINKYV